jgi:hypothetical protein
MKLLKAAVVLAAILASALIALDADAHGRHRHRSSVGIYFGVPGPFHYYPRYYSPRYYSPPRYYYPPAVVVPAPSYPPVYIEQSPPAAAPAPSSSSSGAYWYYCRDSQTYYPYVQQCASPWQQVVPNSSPPS